MSAEAFSSLLKTDDVKFNAIVRASGATVESGRDGLGSLCGLKCETNFFPTGVLHA